MADRSHSNNSFLPSGAIEGTKFATYHHSPMISPSGKAPIPRSVPDHIPSWSQTTHFPATKSLYNESSSHPQGNQPYISPPISRSGSTDEGGSTLAEDWRRYAQNLREQYKGERAHLVADHARADEIMAEEREIHDQERQLLRDEAASLRAELAQLRNVVAAYQEKFGELDNITIPAPTAPLGGIISPPGLSFLNRPGLTSPLHRPSAPTALSGARAASFGSNDQTRISPRSEFEALPQETIRETSGAPVWAPETGPAVRSFDHNVAVDTDMEHLATDDVLHVPTREFRPDDFRILSPEEHKARDEVSEAGSTIGDGIPGANISPQLDGVILRATAVAPAFRINSPSPAGTPLGSPPSAIKAASPPHLDINSVTDGLRRTIEAPLPDSSTNEQTSLNKSLLNDITNRDRQGSGSDCRQSSAELLKAAPDERLTANAGHTPVHSRTASKIDIDFIGSGDVTPTRGGRSREHDNSFDNERSAIATTTRVQFDGPLPEEVILEEEEIEDDGDRPLASPLAMGHKANRGDSFILQLNERLFAVAEAQARRGSILSEVSEADVEMIKTMAAATADEERSVPNPGGQELDDEIKPLRIKPSLNFGKAFGQK